MPINSLSLTKTAAMAFGLFALLAISARTAPVRKQVVLVEKTAATEGQQIPAGVTDVKSAPNVEQKSDIKSDVKTVETNEVAAVDPMVVDGGDAVAEQQHAAKEKVNVHVHINVKRDQGMPLQLTAQEIEEVNAALLKTVQAAPVQTQTQAHKIDAVESATDNASQRPQQKPVVKDAQVDPQAQKVETVDTVDVHDTTNVEKPATVLMATQAAPKKAAGGSMSMFLIPMLAVAAAAMVVKYRRPGMLPEMVEDHLDALGYPASTQSFADAPSRSMYGAV